MTSPRTLSSEQCFKLLQQLATSDGTEAGQRKAVRNNCIGLLMLDTGIRVGELVQVRIGDLYFQGEPVTSLRIRAEIAKTKTERTIPTTDRLKQAIEMLKVRVWDRTPWLQNHYAFFNHDARHSLTPRQVQRIITVAAGLSLGFPVHPHLLRHTFGTRVLSCSNLRIAQELLGHKSVRSTQIYTHPSADDKKRAIANLGCEISGTS